jgi:hypothetical protein
MARASPVVYSQRRWRLGMADRKIADAPVYALLVLSQAGPIDAATKMNSRLWVVL